MSRFGNKLRSGFFAVPPIQGELLKKLLEPKGEGSWFDPTCGEGEILKQLAEGRENEVTTYGVELDRGRAIKATQVLTHCINAPIESMVVSHESFSLILLNPPYDYTVKGMDDDKAERKEFIELIRNFKYLQEGGIMIYIIPSYRFTDERIARYLATYFKDVAITRFTDEDYEDYSQCIFIGRKKTEKHKEANTKLFDFLMNMDNEDFIRKKVAPLSAFIGKHSWSVPGGPVKVKTFYTRLENKDEYYKGILGSTGFQAFINRTKPKELEIGGNPILPLNQGQMALLLASGAVNGLLGAGDTLHAVQGLENVRTIEEKEVMHHDSGSSTTKVTGKTKREVSVKFITPGGLVKKLV